VVESLAVQWGAFKHGQAQVVWCDFAEPLRAPGADTWAWLRTVLVGLSLSQECAAPLHGALSHGAG